MQRSLRRRLAAGSGVALVALACMASPVRAVDTFDDVVINGTLSVLGTVFMNDAEQTAILIGDNDDTVAITSNTLSLSDGDWSITSAGDAVFTSINGMIAHEQEDGFHIVGGVIERTFNLMGGDLTLNANGTTSVTLPTSGVLATVDGVETFTNKTFVDNSLTIQDDADPTKQLHFQLSGIGTGTARTVTVPNASGTMTLLGNTTTGSGSIVLSGSPTLVTPNIGVATATSVNGITLTPNADGFSLAGGTTSRTLSVTGGNVTLSVTGNTTITIPSGATLATTTGAQTLDSKTLTNAGPIAVSAADSLTVGGVIVPQHLEVQFNGVLNSFLTDQTFFIANRSYRVLAVRAYHDVGSLLASNVQVTKDGSTGNPGNGVDLLTDNSGSGFTLQGTVDTVQTGSLVSSSSDRTLNAGDRLSVDFSGTLGSAAGLTIVVSLERI